MRLTTMRYPSSRTRRSGSGISGRRVRFPVEDCSLATGDRGSKLMLSLSAVAALLVLGPSGTAFAQERGIQVDPNGPLIQLRLAREAPAPGFRAMQFLASDSVIYVEERDIISDKDIEYAHAVRRPGGLVIIDLRLTREGASRLLEATKAHLRGRMAILVGSRLVTAPVIAGPVGATATRSLLVGLRDLSSEDAGEVMAAVEVRWPRR